MHVELTHLFAVIVLASAFVGILLVLLNLRETAVRIDSTVFLQTGDTLSIIVTAEDRPAAARAVEDVGGWVTSDFEPLDAVAAIIPADQLHILAGDPAVYSVVGSGDLLPQDLRSGAVPAGLGT